MLQVANISTLCFALPKVAAQNSYEVASSSLMSVGVSRQVPAEPDEYLQRLLSGRRSGADRSESSSYQRTQQSPAPWLPGIPTGTSSQQWPRYAVPVLEYCGADASVQVPFTWAMPNLWVLPLSSSSRITLECMLLSAADAARACPLLCLLTQT